MAGPAIAFAALLEAPAGEWDAARTALALVVGVAISVLFVGKILTSDHTPAATLNWVFVILVAPYVGIVLYYLLSHRVRLRSLKKRAKRVSRLGGRPVRQDDSALPEHPLARFVARMEPESIASGNRVELLATGSEFFDTLERTIQQAERFVHLESYIFNPDATGMRVLGMLEEAARRGVEVRLLYDSIGSWSLRSSHLAPLHAVGGKAAPYFPLLWRRRPFTLNLRNHRKLAVVDGTRALLGGRNIAEEYEFDRSERGAWFDVMMLVEGPSVAALQWVFTEDWHNAAEEDLSDPRYFPAVAEAGDACLGVLASGPDRVHNRLRFLLLEAIGRARESIHISSPYLVPDATMLAALEVAAIRGVKVHLHKNGREAEQFVLYHAARSFYPRLLEVGIEITETTDDYNHAKMFIVDGEQMFLGSANLDMRSFELNFEVGTLVLEPAVCRQAQQLMAERSARGRKVTRLTRSRGARLLDGACRVLSPIL